MFAALLCWLRHLWKYRGAVQMANSLPLERCRQILGDACELTDNELMLLRDDLCGVARVIVEACPRQQRGNGSQNASDAPQQAIDHETGESEPKKPVGFPDTVATLPEQGRYEVEERAAIMEHDGGLDRDAAEQAAFALYLRSKNREN